MDELQPRRGRPPKYHESTETISPPRPTRKPFGAMEQKLAYASREGFHRHWFNDEGSRIERALEAAYTHVQDKDGKNVSKVVGTAEGGGPLTAFLMELPEDLYKEDMAAQEQLVAAKEEAIRRGEFESQKGDGRYVPKQGISIKSGS